MFSLSRLVRTTNTRKQGLYDVRSSHRFHETATTCLYLTCTSTQLRSFSVCARLAWTEVSSIRFTEGSRRMPKDRLLILPRVSRAVHYLIIFLLDLREKSVQVFIGNYCYSRILLSYYNIGTYMVRIDRTHSINHIGGTHWYCFQNTRIKRICINLPFLTLNLVPD